MRMTFSATLALACALPLGAQMTVTLSGFPGPAEVTIRNESAGAALTAFAVRGNHVIRGEPSNRGPRTRRSLSLEPLLVDTLMDVGVEPLSPGGERRFPIRVWGREESPEDDFEPKPLTSAAIFADGSTTGDAALIDRLLLRRSNMLFAVETALETLAGQGASHYQLIVQFRRMRDSLRRWYLRPDQQVGLRVYGPILARLTQMRRRSGESPDPLAGLIWEESARLRRQRVALAESQPGLASELAQGPTR